MTTTSLPVSGVSSVATGRGLASPYCAMKLRRRVSSASLLRRGKALPGDARGAKRWDPRLERQNPHTVLALLPLWNQQPGVIFI